MQYATFCLVVATYGRKLEIDNFLNSILHQKYRLDLVKVWIVDQNDKIDLLPIINQYSDKLQIEHIKTDRKGASYSRNLAIYEASGDIIAFPDDDCIYYEDTLENVNLLFNQNPKAGCMLGRIFDCQLNKNIIRRWKTFPFKINWWNFYNTFSEIVLFVDINKISNNTFSERFGPGEYFGSCEGIDYLANILRNKVDILYSPKINVWHPIQNIEMFNVDKVRSYGLGFGAFCRKNLNLPIFILFFETLIYHSFFYVIARLKNNREKMKIRRECLVSRVQGWREWKN
jgi:glycosyltransferase involved in cell wall biosynthesis